MDLAVCETQPDAAERQQRLVSELSHRVKNMLSVVIAIAHQTARNSPNLDHFQKAFIGRMETLARGHDLLVASQWTEVGLAELASIVLGAEVEAGRASVAGDPIMLSANQVTGLSLILHELYTNALKYGALARPGGRIDLDWRVDAGDAVLRWSESGPGEVAPPSDEGFGRQMIAMTAQADLQGSSDFDWRDEGLQATLRFPLAA